MLRHGGQAAPGSLIGLAPVRNPASTNKPGFCVSKVVVLFSRETRAFALQRHWELRLDHAGRPVRFEYRNEERDDVREMFAVTLPRNCRR